MYSRSVGQIPLSKAWGQLLGEGARVDFALDQPVVASKLPRRRRCRQTRLSLLKRLGRGVMVPSEHLTLSYILARGSTADHFPLSSSFVKGRRSWSPPNTLGPADPGSPTRDAISPRAPQRSEGSSDSRTPFCSRGATFQKSIRLRSLRQRPPLRSFGASAAPVVSETRRWGRPGSPRPSLSP